MLAGNRVLPGMQPYAARYGGHQFGHWAGQLGDGRAITLGEVIATDGTRQELQLKGAGRTPYSRTADGRAVLRSSLREFVCSEAMHFLGVPTTRALSLVGTGEQVIRDMFYDGHPAPEPGAVVCRVAPSFLRFGNFEIHARPRGDRDPRRSSPTTSSATAFSRPVRMRPGIQEVCRRTALLIADWMRLGFVHGVMNTDNMSILGLTIDYGPYGWLEGYDPQWTPNTTDAQTRRYAYGNQPQIAHWNLARLAEALLPLVPDKGAVEEGLTLYAETFNSAWQRALAHKLGFAALDQPGDDQLLHAISSRCCYASRDRLHALLPQPRRACRSIPRTMPRSWQRAFYADPSMGTRDALASWLRRYAARAKQATGRVERMNGSTRSTCSGTTWRSSRSTRWSAAMPRSWSGR